MANTAYDFDYFAPQKPKAKAEIKVVKGTKPKAKSGKKNTPMKSVLCCVAVVTVFFAVMYNRAVYTELCNESTEFTKTLSELKSEETRLSLGIEGMVSMRRVEEYAQNQLGLIKAEGYQTTYVSFTSEDKVEIAKSEPNLIEKVVRAVVGCFTGDYE